MAIEYAKSALSESIIPVKDYPLASGVSQNIGDLVTINADGEIANVGLTDSLVTTTTNLGVSEGNNFEGLGVTPKVGKVRVSGNAIYRAPYGTVAANGGFTAVAPTQTLVGEVKAIGKSTSKGFVVDSAGANGLVKIVDIDNRGNVLFQFVSSALFTF